MSKTLSINNFYLFYITLFAIFSTFFVFPDYICQSYLQLDVDFIAPYPSETLKIISIILGAFGLALLIVFFSIKSNRTGQLEYFSVTVLRYTLAFAMIAVYGFCKTATKQFELTYNVMDSLVKEVSDHDLTWYFYGRSNIQTLFFGLMELIPGILLLFRRTTFIGALILLPVLANIAILNIFNHIEFHTLLYAIAFNFIDLGILLFYRKEVIKVFIGVKDKLKNTFVNKKTRLAFLIVKVVFVVMVMLRYVDAAYYSIQYNGFLNIFGAFQLEKVTYNNQIQDLDSLPNYWNKLYIEKSEVKNLVRDKDEKNLNTNLAFSEGLDSLKILTYNLSTDGKNEIDTTGFFYGTFKLTEQDSVLTLRGLKNDTLMVAHYKKMPINGHDWWW